MNVSAACCHFRSLRSITIIALMLSAVSATVLADEPVTAAAVKEPTAATSSGDNKIGHGRRIAVIIQGHPGDAAHAELYRSSMEKIRGGMIAHYGFLPDDVHVFSGDGENNAEDGNAVQDPVTAGDGDAVSSPAATGLPEAEQTESTSTPEFPQATAAPAAAPPKSATRDSIAAELLKLNTGISADDSLFVIVMGHTHFENNLAWFNLPGPDLQQKEFAELFQGFQAKEQVFIITIPCSGYYIRNLSGPGRYIISATEADLEVNETLSPHALADLISAEPNPEWDLNKDKNFSLFEFYIALCQNVATRYSDETLIATEHGLLDDNGDGRGTELQMHFLSEEQGGLPKNRQRQTLTEGRDGMASSRFLLIEFPK